MPTDEKYLYDFESKGDIQNCQSACQDQYKESVCNSFNYEVANGNCSFLSTDVIDAGNQLEDKSEVHLYEWQCLNSKWHITIEPV